METVSAAFDVPTVIGSTPIMKERKNIINPLNLLNLQFNPILIGQWIIYWFHAVPFSNRNSAGALAADAKLMWNLKLSVISDHMEHVTSLCKKKRCKLAVDILHSDGIHCLVGKIYSLEGVTTAD